MIASHATLHASARPLSAPRPTQGRCRRRLAPPRCSAAADQVRDISPPFRCLIELETALQIHQPLASGSLQDRHAAAAAAAPQPLARLARSTAAAAAAALLLLGPGAPASLADVTTVTAQQAVDMAKPLKQQQVNKGRIWALFVLGATALFGSTGAQPAACRLLAGCPAPDARAAAACSMQCRHGLDGLCRL